jgi:hypothetical protein
MQAVVKVKGYIKTRYGKGIIMPYVLISSCGYVCINCEGVLLEVKYNDCDEI